MEICTSEGLAAHHSSCIFPPCSFAVCQLFLHLCPKYLNKYVQIYPLLKWNGWIIRGEGEKNEFKKNGLIGKQHEFKFSYKSTQFNNLVLISIHLISLYSQTICFIKNTFNKNTFYTKCNNLPLPPGYAPTLSANDTYPGKGKLNKFKS